MDLLSLFSFCHRKLHIYFIEERRRCAMTLATPFCAGVGHHPPAVVGPTGGKGEGTRAEEEGDARKGTRICVVT